MEVETFGLQHASSYYEGCPWKTVVNKECPDRLLYNHVATGTSKIKLVKTSASFVLHGWSCHRMDS